MLNVSLPSDQLDSTHLADLEEWGSRSYLSL